MKRRRNFRTTKQLLASIILVQLSWCPIWGLDPDKKIDRYLVDKWDTDDGIPSNDIRSIAQTPDGYLWIVTGKGLVRFDGVKFSIIPFTEKETIDSREAIIPGTLFVDRGGTLWIGSSGVLTSYNYQTGQFKTFTSADGLTGGQIRCIKDDINGNLWIGLWVSYLNRLTDGRFTAFNSSDGLVGKKVNVIIEDMKGNLIFGTRENGVFKYKDGKFFKYPITGLKGYLVAMHEDQKGTLWIGTSNGLLRKTANTVETYTTKYGLSDNHIAYILEDSRRNLWIGTIKGLNRLKKVPDGKVSFESILKPVTILCLFEDREGSLWVGTYESGLKRLKDGKFTSYTPLETLEAYQDEMPLSVFEDWRGDTWIGTLKGKLFRCRGSDVIESVESPQLSGIGIFAIAEDAEGNLWVGTNGKGVFQKKNKTFVQLTSRDGLTDNTVTSIYRDSRDNLWFSTPDGVSVLRSPDGSIESFNSRDGLLGKVVHNVCEDSAGNIWIAADKGITLLTKVFAGSRGQKKSFFKKRPWSPKAILPGVPVTCIYEDPSASDSKGRVFWIATHGRGLKRLSIKDHSIVSYTTDNGMTTDFIYQFFEDQQGNFWFMSDSGILRVSKTELNDFAGGKPGMINCISFGISEGLKNTEFNDPFSRHSALKTKNGELWFVTKKGISIVDPEKVRINKLPPPVKIEVVYFDRHPIPLHQDQYVFKGITDFSFHFTATTLLSSEKVAFRYRLEGLDETWVSLPPGKERVAHYWNLDPGTYTFRVIASNAEGVWNRTGDSMTFILKPFLYQTLVFKIAVLLMLAALLTAVIYLYKKRPFEKKEKYKGSSLNPHFAEECIKKIRYLMEVEKIYRDVDISLQSVAKRLSITPHLLSQILNDQLDCNFPDFINSQRVEEAKKILRSPGGSGRKITMVALEVGFNAMPTFYRAFKKYTGMTPNQYKKDVQQRKK
jgi:ligand-binding sensor domain-containing protein/AraC-like DNA-binding protein